MNQRFSCRIAYLYSILFATPVMQKFNYLLFHMGLRGLGVLNYHDDVVSGERYFIDRTLPKLISTQYPVFFDVGANEGSYSSKLAENFPSAQIYAFEPHPVTFAKLSQLKWSNLFCFNEALGSAPGQLTLFDRADSDGSHHATLHESVIRDIHHQQTTKHVVKVDTLDSFAGENKIDFIDLLKIDTEGNEFAILSGASHLLAQKRIGIIQFEFNEMNVISRSFFRDFRIILRNHKLFRLLPRGVLELSESPVAIELYAFQNILAVPVDRVYLLRK